MVIIKRILKGIFPRIFLKKCFLIYNTIKLRSWDSFFFPEEVIDSTSYRIFENTNPFLDNKISIEKFPHAIKKRLKLWINPEWKQDQYLLIFRRSGLMEPKMGWAMTNTHRLIFQSLGFSRAPHVPRPDWVATYFGKPKVTGVSRIISLRDSGEQNYFHFFNDVLAKLFFLKENKINLKDFTIVVSEKLFQKEFFQFYFQHTWMKDLSWYVQKNEWIKFEEAIFCKPYTHTKKFFDAAIALIGSQSSPIQHKRIFLTRSSRSFRFIENIEEIYPVLVEFGFQIEDTTNLPFLSQIMLFRNCRHLVAIHGAGLTNMIFREEKPLNVLEIVQPSSYIPFHYIMLAHQYHYNYNILAGMKGNAHNMGGFRVDPDQLRFKIKEMVETN